MLQHNRWKICSVSLSVSRFICLSCSVHRIRDTLSLCLSDSPPPSFSLSASAQLWGSHTVLLVKAGGHLEPSRAVLSPTTVPDKMKAKEKGFFVWARRSAFSVTPGLFKGFFLFLLKPSTLSFLSDLSATTYRHLITVLSWAFSLLW